MMIFLKALLFIPANMLVAFLLVFLIRRVLFYPRKQYYFHGKKIPFTPGIIVKYYQKIINKIDDLIYGFLHDTETDYEGNRINRWEEKVYKNSLAWLEKKIQIKIVPSKILSALQIFLAGICREFAKQFLRTFLPYLLSHYNITHYVDIFKDKFTIDFLQGYYDKYIYKYSLYFMLVIGFIIGFVNTLIYLIIGG